VLPPLSLACCMHRCLAGADLWLGWMPAAYLAVLASGLLFVLEQARTRSQRDRVFNNLASYLPSEVAEEIAYSLPSSTIVAERKDFTLLSADLRNFSVLAKRDHQKNQRQCCTFSFRKRRELSKRTVAGYMNTKAIVCLRFGTRKSASVALQRVKRSAKNGRRNRSHFVER
jgi:adenylate cyclase